MEKIVVKFVNKEDVKKASKTFFQEYVPGIKLVAKGDEMEIEFQSEAPQAPQIMQSILDYELVEMSCNEGIDTVPTIAPDLVLSDSLLQKKNFDNQIKNARRRN